MSDNNSSRKPENLVPKEIGISGKLTKGFLHNPLTPLLLIGFLLLGIVGLIATPRQEDPQISVPMADIFVQYPGASAEQVTNQIAIPLEQEMMEIKGVDHVYSASMRDQAIVTVQFVVGEDLEESLVKVYDKLASNIDRMPQGASEPLVKPKSVDDVPLVTLTLWSEEVDDASLRLVALDLLKHIKRVPNTSQGFIVSGRRDQMTISLYPEKLAGHGVTLDQVASTIRASNSERNAGAMEVGGTVTTVYTGGFLRSVMDLQRLVVGISNGAPVYLRDVADVHRGPNEASSMVSFYTGKAYGNEHGENDENSEVLDIVGASAVTVAIAKKKSSNGVSVAEDVLSLVEDLKGRVIPDNIHVAVTRNYGETAKEKVNELIFKLFVATGAVVILVWFFLGWRAAAVVAVVVPIVITFTVFMALILGFTIDRVSLFALIFSIGILVDDAIVVVENIYRRWLEKNEINDEITISAVDEVGNPTILATFTVVAALLPMAAVRGMMGPYMMPIPVLGSVAMIFSLFAAFVFTPWLANKWRPSMETLREAEKKEHRQAEFLGKLYNSTIRRMVENKRNGQFFLVSLFIVFFLSMSLFYFQGVRVKMLPLDNKPEFNIVVNFPEGTALPETANLVAQIAEKVRQMDQVTAIQTYVGTASPYNFNGLVRHYYLRNNPWEADLQIQLTHKNSREQSSHDLAVLVREMIRGMAKEAGARVQIVEMPPGPPVLQSVVAEVYGPDANTRRKVATDLQAFFEQAEHLDDVDTLMPSDTTIWNFKINREKAQRVGVNVDSINRTLEMAMGGFQLGDIKHNSVLDITPIVMEIPLAARSDFGGIGQLPVPTLTGGTVPLSELGEFVKGKQDPTIFHKDLRPVEFVTAETVGKLAAPIYGMNEVSALMRDYVSPDGVKGLTGERFGPPANSYETAFEWGGEWTVTYETFRDMGIAFGIALIMIYMLVVWEFGNFILPAIVMAPIPLTLVGIVPGHWIMNAEFTATSMIGFIALAGIIVRNSILLVDFSKREIEKGMPVLDALIFACQVRTRPIVITALALVGGSSVILFDPIFQGMAVSLLFGVLVSTALTLFIIPLGCYSARDAFLNTSTEELASSGGDSGGDSGSQATSTAKTAGFIGAKSAAALGLVGRLAFDISKSAGSAAVGMGKSGIQKFKNRKANQANNEVLIKAEEQVVSKGIPTKDSVDSLQTTQPIQKTSVTEPVVEAKPDTTTATVELKKPPVAKKVSVKKVAPKKPVVKKSAPKKEIAKKPVTVRKKAAPKTAAPQTKQKSSSPPAVSKKAPDTAKSAATAPTTQVPASKQIDSPEVPPAQAPKAKSKGRRGIRLKGL